MMFGIVSIWLCDPMHGEVLNIEVGDESRLILHGRASDLLRLAAEIIRKTETAHADLRDTIAQVEADCPF